MTHFARVSVNSDDQELLALVDRLQAENAQLRVDAERWRTVLCVIDKKEPVYFSNSAEFTAAIDKVRTQKAPG